MVGSWKVAPYSRFLLKSNQLCKRYLHMWTLCRQDWAATNKPVASPPSPAATTSGGTPTKSTTTDDKVPKTLPPGTWSTLIKKYQEEKLHGVNRIFPQRELLGAEATLARMHHELHQSHMFTPIPLGEIVERRSFTARATRTL